jgi:hypothetical protein
MTAIGMNTHTENVAEQQIVVAVVPPDIAISVTAGLISTPGRIAYCVPGDAARANHGANQHRKIALKARFRHRLR